MSVHPIVEDAEPVAWIEQQSYTYKWYVYLLETDYGWYKIGSANDVSKRMETIGILLPFEIRMAHTVQADRALLLEKKLHKRFADKHINGEWFALDAADVAFIKSLPTSMTNEHVLDIIFDGETYDYRFRNRIRHADIDWRSLDTSMSSLEFILLREFSDVRRYVEGDGVNPVFADALASTVARGWVRQTDYTDRSIYEIAPYGRRLWKRIEESFHSRAPATIERILIDQRLQNGVVQLGLFAEDGNR